MQGYKVVTAKEMARVEALALQNGSNEKEFIEQAGQRVADAALESIHRTTGERSHHSCRQRQ